MENTASSELRESVEPRFASLGIPRGKGAPSSSASNATSDGSRGPSRECDVTRLMHVHEMGMRCVQAGEVAPLLDSILATALELPGAEGGTVHLVDAETGDLRLANQRGIAAELSHLPAHRIPLADRHGTTLGTMSIHFGEPHRPSAMQWSMVERVATQAADFIGERRSREQLEARCTRSEHACARAEAAERSKDDFLAGVAHELRQPLAAALPAVEIQKRSLRPERRDRAREVIDHQLRHMSQLVDDLSDLSRIQRGTLVVRRERLDLRTVVERAVEMARPLLEQKRHHLEVDTECGPAWTIGDSTRLTQVFSNLLHNAAAYTPPGGQIQVSIDDAGDRRLNVRVRDSGDGISADALDRIFEPFERGARAPQSSASVGIGLALVRQIVHLHGGTVTATSDGSGQGSEFVVTLNSATDEPLSIDRPTEHGAPDRTVNR
jgi:signal transduction histidine kinase